MPHGLRDHPAVVTAAEATKMVSFSRRALLAASAAGGLLAGAAARVKAQTFGNPDLPPQGAINAQNPRSLNDPGPQNPALASQFPSAVSPPATDVGGLPQNWASFNNASKRIENGGWARQVTQADFALSESISGVNMRLTAGGIRELHWHLAGEWAYMSYGNCRVTVFDEQSRMFVSDVKEGDMVLSRRPAAFAARHRLRRLRVHHRLR
jgi:oxalate decarboxylase